MPSPASSCSATTAGQRWQDGELTGPGSPPAVQAARQALPGVLSRAGAPDGTWVEDKGHALAVHTRRAAAPEPACASSAGRWKTWPPGSGWWPNRAGW